MLDVTLSTKPVKPTAVIISGSLRAGKTLTTTKYLKMWLDSHNAKADAICQSIGRCLGYSSHDHDKFSNNFMVFCNTKELDACIEFFNKYDCAPNIPSGNWNKPYITESSDGEYIELPFSSEQEIRQILQDVATISKCSKNNAHDIALTVFNNSNRGHSLEDNKKFRIYYLDGPSEKFKKSWNTLKNQKNKLIGKFVKFNTHIGIKNKTSNEISFYLRESMLLEQKE